MTSTERFTEALELTHSSSTTVSNRERLNAEQYLMTLRDSAEGLNLSFYIITNEPVNDLRYFWAFNAIKHHIPSIAGTVDDQQANELYRSLFSFIHRYLFASPSTTPADYVLNKHAQLMVVGLRHFFPNRWNNFFADIFDLLARGRAAPPAIHEAVTTYFLRIFEYIDEQVVNVRDQVDRGRQQRSLDMQIKDAMRESVIPRAVETWFSVLNECRYRATETANLCLAVVQTYIEWIDVTLVMTADWMNLLYFLVTVPPVRVAACECLLSLITKKQLTGMKLASLATLNVVEALPRLLSLLVVPPNSDEDAAFFDVVVRLFVSVGEQFLSLLEVCRAQLAAQEQGIDSQTGLVAAPVVTAETVAGGVVVVQDRPYQLSPRLIDQLSASLHGSVTHLLRLLRVAPVDSCDTLLLFFQLYSKSAFMNESETMQLLLVTFDMSKIRNLAVDEGRVWDDNVIDQRRTLHTLLRLLHRRSPSLVFEYAYNLAERLVLVWNHTPSECGSVQPITAVGRSGGSRLAFQGTASAAHSTNNNNTNCNNHNGDDCRGECGSQQHQQPSFCGSGPPLSTSASLHALSDTDGAGVGNDRAGGRTDAGSLFLHQMGPSIEEPQNFRDPAVVEAVLRFVYEVGESVKQEILRDETDAFTLVIAHIVTCEPLVGAEQTNSGVHLTFFELVDRYVTFFQYHTELLPVLLHRLLLLPGGVMNRNDRVRTRIDYLFSHLLQVLRACLYPYAADMITALQSILTSTGYLLPNDRRQLFEAIGTLLSIVLSQPIGQSAAAAAAASASQNTSLSLGGAIAVSGVNGEEERIQQQQYIASVMDGLVRPAVGSVVQLLLCCDGGDASGGACNGLASSPPAAADVSVADAISYISAVAKGLSSGVSSPSSSSSSSGASSAGSLQGSFIDPTGGSGSGASAGQCASTSVAQHFTAVTEQVLPVMARWSGSASVRDAGSQFFQQMVNMVPYDLLEPYYEAFVEQSLSWMEAVTELSRLLRLMFQLVNKAGPRCIAGVARLTPRLWDKVVQVGLLDDDAGAIMNMGVLSETARERVDVFRQLFTYIFNVATWGSAPGLLLIHTAYLAAIVQQLLAATALPIELELPRAALQTLTKLTLELCGVSAALAAELNGTATATAGTSQGENANPSNTNTTAAAAAASLSSGSTRQTSAALAELVRATPDAAALQSQLNSAEMAFSQLLLEKVIPSVLQVLVEPSFNLRDAKSLSMTIGETGQLCKMAIARLGDAAMQSIFNFFAPLVGSDEAMGFCTTLRDQPKLNSTLKIRFRDMLIRAQEQVARTR